MATSPSTAREIVAAVRSGTLSPVEAVQSALDAITAAEPRIDAFQIVRTDRALAEATALAERSDLNDLALAGLPIAIKDNVPVQSEPMRDGCVDSSVTPQTQDHPVVERLRTAGAVVVGLTTAPELCLFGATDSAFGVTRNPWNADRTPGGSSGGSAAAVAAGVVPVAHGNDGLGSIRIPAACCGLFGIKPGLGLVPAELGASSWFGMAENGPLSTTVQDAALVLSVMAAAPGLADVSTPARPLRIAVHAGTATPLAKLSPEWKRGVLETARALEAAGHTVTHTRFPYPVSIAPLIARWTQGALDDAAAVGVTRLERRTRMHARIGKVVARLGLVKEESADAWRAKATAFFADYDILLTPTLAQAPLEALEWHKKSWLSNVLANVRYAPNPSFWNMVGWPAASVPAGIDQTTGTPLGVQMSTPPQADGGGEALLLSLALQLEQLRPWPRTAS